MFSIAIMNDDDKWKDSGDEIVQEKSSDRVKKRSSWSYIDVSSDEINMIATQLSAYTDIRPIISIVKAAKERKTTRLLDCSVKIKQVSTIQEDYVDAFYRWN